MFSEEYIHKAWVFKQSDYLKKWRKRFMVISKTQISTYESEDLSKSPTCTLFPKHCRGIKSDDEKTKQKFGFIIDYEGKDFLFYVETAEEQKKWLNVVGQLKRKSNSSRFRETNGV